MSEKAMPPSAKATSIAACVFSIKCEEAFSNSSLVIVSSRDKGFPFFSMIKGTNMRVLSAELNSILAFSAASFSLTAA